MEITAHLHRNKQDDKESLGVMTLETEEDILFTSLCLELGWKGNNRNISCVPIGVYPLVLEYSPRFDRFLWELKNVPNRSECKIHVANEVKQLNGCQALGSRKRKKLVGKSSFIYNSRRTLADFHEVLKGKTKITLTITGDECIN